MKSKFNLKARDHLQSGESKRRFNKAHFAESAPRYDTATKLLSFGLDASWKRRLAREFPEIESPECLDVACGTGDISFLLAEKYPDGEILGIDLTREMVKIANQRNTYSSVKFSVSDMCKLSLADDSIDVLTGGYAIRNAPVLDMALQEFHRILKPGGHLLLLDFSKPNTRILQSIQYLLLKIWGSFCGLLLHSNPEVHGYISESMGSFPGQKDLEEEFISHGFHIQKSIKLLFGMMMIYSLVTESAGRD